MKNIVESLHNKEPVTYADLHKAGITTMDALRNAVNLNWPKMSSTGITRRTNAIWKRINLILKPLPTESIADSVWSVAWDTSSASRDHDKYPHIAGNSYPSETVGEVYTFEKLGWVSAPDVTSATMIAQTMLGSRAHDKIHIHRVGVGGWQRAIAENKKLLRKCEKLVESYHMSIQRKMWATETVEHSIVMLQMLNQQAENGNP